MVLSTQALLIVLAWPRGHADQWVIAIVSNYDEYSLWGCVLQCTFYWPLPWQHGTSGMSSGVWRRGQDIWQDFTVFLKRWCYFFTLIVIPNGCPLPVPSKTAQNSTLHGYVNSWAVRAGGASRSCDNCDWLSQWSHNQKPVQIDSNHD